MLDGPLRWRRTLACLLALAGAARATVRAVHAQPWPLDASLPLDGGRDAGGRDATDYLRDIPSPEVFGPSADVPDNDARDAGDAGDAARDAPRDASADDVRDAPSMDAGARPPRPDAAMRCVPIESDEDEGDGDGDAPPREEPRRDGGADAADAGCAPPSTAVDRAGHCCLPGQTWAGGRCAGATTSCAPGETRGASGQCARRSAPPGDAGAPSARLFEAPRVAAPPAMAVIPGGVFRAGGQWVSVGPFAIDRTEVTAAAYARCVAAGVCNALPDPFGQMAVAAAAPAVNVPWSAARRYCGWAGGRLPTEAEWELAARGLDGRRYPWGERLPDCALARHAGCGDAALRVGALPAGRSPFGLLDMAGNVAEWVSDVFATRRAGDDTRVAMDPTGPVSGAQRVVRGGSFQSNPPEVTAESRRGVDEREARGDVGFRCARGL